MKETRLVHIHAVHGGFGEDLFQPVAVGSEIAGHEILQFFLERFVLFLQITFKNQVSAIHFEFTFEYSEMNTDVFGNLFQFKREAALVGASRGYAKNTEMWCECTIGERLASYVPVRGRILYYGNALLLFKCLCHQ